MLLVESSNHALDQIFSNLNRMRFGCMHDVGKWWIFFPFISPFFFPVVFLIFCWLEWLRVWTYLFIQVSAIHYIQIVETDMTSLLCVAEALEALVIIFSCLLWHRDFFGTVNKLEVLQLGIAFYLFATGRPCNIPWRRSGLNLKLARSCMVLVVHFFLPCQILISLRMLFHSIFVLLLMYLYYCSFGLLWKIWSVKSLEKTHRNNNSRCFFLFFFAFFHFSFQLSLFFFSFLFSKLLSSFFFQLCFFFFFFSIIFF